MANNLISIEESLSNQIDEKIMKEQQNLKNLKFFDTSNIGWNGIIQLIKDENSMNIFVKVKKIKKFQSKRKQKMNRNQMLKQIAMEEVLGILENL
ncbi:unnamed protein product [Paramecium pentaurelia]|uniref:Uncharacterized protein n=1 Tax=Paramecium pentaurelia TaxID=43138 RepID=A0A8S1V2G7_9CILI|nr:unnamed protein product [Paramecium pentaurelia]